MAAVKADAPDPAKMYEPILPYAHDLKVFNPNFVLAGDHPEVRANFGRWLDASLPDDEKSKLRNAALFGEMPVVTPPAPPRARRLTSRVRALGTWLIEDEDLGGPFQLNQGELRAADDPVVQKYAHLFGPVVEERAR
jgi:hypothetical protein